MFSSPLRHTQRSLPTLDLTRGQIFPMPGRSSPRLEGCTWTTEVDDVFTKNLKSEAPKGFSWQFLHTTWIGLSDFCYGLGSHGIHRRHSPPFGRICFTFSKHRISKSKTVLAISKKSKDASLELSCVFVVQIFVDPNMTGFILKTTSDNFHEFLLPPNQLGQVGRIFSHWKNITAKTSLQNGGKNPCKERIPFHAGHGSLKVVEM